MSSTGESLWTYYICLISISGFSFWSSYKYIGSGFWEGIARNLSMTVEYILCYQLKVKDVKEEHFFFKQESHGERLSTRQKKCQVIHPNKSRIQKLHPESVQQNSRWRIWKSPWTVMRAGQVSVTLRKRRRKTKQNTKLTWRWLKLNPIQMLVLRARQGMEKIVQILEERGRRKWIKMS